MNQNDKIKKWLVEAGREKPSKGFSHLVMAAVERSRSAISPYTPVISPWVLRLIFGGLAVIYLMIIALSPEGSSDSVYLDKVKAFTEKSPLKVPEVSLPTFSLPEMDWGFLGTNPVFAYSLLALATMAILMAWKQSHQTAFSHSK